MLVVAMIWWFCLEQADHGRTDPVIFHSNIWEHWGYWWCSSPKFSALKPIQGHGYHICSILGHSLWLTSYKQKLHWHGKEQQRMMRMEGIMLSTHQWALSSLRHPQPEMNEDADQGNEVLKIIKLASSWSRNRGSLMLLGQVTTLSWFVLNVCKMDLFSSRNF